jgi:hypothetical protein
MLSDRSHSIQREKAPLRLCVNTRKYLYLSKIDFHTRLEIDFRYPN